MKCCKLNTFFETKQVALFLISNQLTSTFITQPLFCNQSVVLTFIDSQADQYDNHPASFVL